jgi:Golgi phosphoprotein 3 (GPP34)
MHEQQPGGHRHRAPPTRGLSGTGLVADDLYLLGHEEGSGKPLLQPSALGTGLAGALLAELLLVSWIALRQQDFAVVITRDAPHDAVRQNPLFKRIADTPEPRPVRSWLRVLAHGATRDVAVRLEEAGYLEHVRGRVPWGEGRWVPVNPDWAFAPVLRARATLDPTRPLTAYSTTLAGLTVACGLGFRLGDELGDDQTSASRPVKDAVARLGPGLQVVINQTEAAIESAVMSYRNTW